MAARPKAIVLLSGGIDSAVAAAELRERYQLVKLTIEYGQPVAEKVAAIAIADWLGIEDRNRILCRIPSFSAIVGPTNYFPARNILFLAHAAQEAERLGCHTIIMGANKDDHNDYPDCRRPFLDGFQRVIEWGTYTWVNIETPLIGLTKIEVVARAITLGVPLDLTMSCYRPRDRTACGECNACKLRATAFMGNGLDPTPKRLEVDFGESKPWEA
jgi:7-cyano-7-deazaguanine synthase